MALNPDRYRVPGGRPALWLRLPVQALFIAWAIAARTPLAPASQEWAAAPIPPRLHLWSIGDGGSADVTWFSPRRPSPSSITATSGTRSPSSATGADEEPLVIERAEGTDLIDAEGRRYIDGVSSLWCNVHGHRHPLIDAGVREQLDRVAHSTMLGLTHPRRRGARGAPGRARAAGPQPRLLLGLGLDRGRDRAQDGVPVLAAARRPARRRTSFVSPARAPTTATPSARSRSAASTSSTPPTRPCCSRRTASSRATPTSSSACSTSTPRRSPR